MAICAANTPKLRKVGTQRDGKDSQETGQIGVNRRFSGVRQAHFHRTCVSHAFFCCDPLTKMKTPNVQVATNQVKNAGENGLPGLYGCLYRSWEAQSSDAFNVARFL